MHVLEIDTESSWAVASIGPAYLAAYLRRQGHEASLLRVRLEADEREIIEAVRGVNPGLIGLSLTTRQWQRARLVARRLRENLDTPLVAGGLHPTFAPQQVLAEPGFDFVCLGEGELALNARMVNAFQLARDAGILVTANYMLGLPGETRSDLEQTLRLHHELLPDDFGFFVFYPYPGTRLFQICLEQG